MTNDAPLHCPVCLTIGIALGGAHVHRETDGMVYRLDSVKISAQCQNGHNFNFTISQDGPQVSLRAYQSWPHPSAYPPEIVESWTTTHETRP